VHQGQVNPVKLLKVLKMSVPLAGGVDTIDNAEGKSSGFIKTILILFLGPLVEQAILPPPSATSFPCVRM